MPAGGGGGGGGVSVQEGCCVVSEGGGGGGGCSSQLLRQCTSQDPFASGTRGDSLHGKNANPGHPKKR